MANSNSDVYTEALLPYRDAASGNAPPKQTRSEDLGRMEIPNRPSFGTPFEDLAVKLTPVSLLDGRRLMAKGEVFSLDEQCIDFRVQPSKVRNWEDPQEVFDVYFPEVEALVRSCVPGANHPDAKVLIYDHVLRTGGKSETTTVGYERGAPRKGFAGYGANVHSDNCIRSMHARIKDHLLGSNEILDRYGRYPAGWGEVRPGHEWRERLFRAETEDHDSPEGQGGEHLIVNVWRPLETVKNWGLAVLDGRSLNQGDVHPTAWQKVEFGYKPSQVRDLDGRLVEKRINELLTPLHEPAHRWIYFPEMQANEALLFKINDSRRDGRPRFGCHTAFRDPRGVPGAHRSSIEVRTVVVLPPNDGSRLGASSRL